MATACAGVCSHVWSQPAAAVCEVLERERSEALASAQAQRIEGAARRYLTACWNERPKALVAVALEEVAAGKRMSGRYSEALEASNQCLQYQYEAIGCHAEKALALAGMRLLGEAMDVVESGRAVGAKELARARQDKEGGRTIRRKERSQEEADQRLRNGDLKESLTKRGLDRLTEIGSRINGAKK